MQVDISDREQVEQFARQISETESLYGLVYNAGGSYDTLAALADQDKAEALFQLNFWAMTRLAGAAARPLMRAKAGRIVTIGSVTSQIGVSGNAIYAASKGRDAQLYENAGSRNGAQRCHGELHCTGLC